MAATRQPLGRGDSMAHAPDELLAGRTSRCFEEDEPLAQPA